MRVFALIKKDIQQILRDWRSALFLVVMPILFTFFFGFVFSSSDDQSDLEDPRLPVGIFMEMKDGPSETDLEEVLAASDAIRPIRLKGDLTQAEQQVSAGELAAVILIPENFERALLRQQEIILTIIADPSSLAAQTAVEAVKTGLSRLQSSVQIAQISSANYAEQVGFDSETQRQTYFSEALELAQLGWQDSPIGIDVEKALSPAIREQEASMGYTQSSPGMMVQFAIFGLITSAMVLVLERKSGALRRLLTTPITKYKIIGGHTFAMFLIVFFQQGLLVLIGQFFFDVNYSREPLAILLMTVVLAAWSSSLGLLIGAISKREEQVVALSLIAMFIFASLGGAWFPLEVAGETFAAFGHLMPTAWAMDGFQNIIVRGLGFSSVLLPAGIILSYTFVFFGLAVWRFQYD